MSSSDSQTSVTAKAVAERIELQRHSAVVVSGNATGEMQRYMVQAVSGNRAVGSERCALCSRSEFPGPSISGHDNVTGDTRLYCNRHFVETANGNRELLEAFLRCLANGSTAA